MAVHVLSAIGLDATLKTRIAAVSPEVSVRVVPARWRGARSARALDEWRKLIAQADILLAHWELPKGLAPHAKRLQWVHVNAAGIDTLADNDLFCETTIPFTTSAGANAPAVAEYALALLLALAKGFPQLMAAQRRRRWQDTHMPQLASGRTLGIVGFGHIGRELAHRALSLGMRVVAMRRSRAGDQSEQHEGITLVQDLHSLLRMSDYVVLALPLTKETEGLMGEAELRAMRPTAYLINVARGAIVSEEALLRALQEGWIAGAALDVFAREPLPRDHPLWKLPNVIISPHIAGIWEGYTEAVVELFCENLRRFLAGQPLMNLVERERGY